MEKVNTKYRLNSIYLNPTRYCNLACRHCWLSPPVGEDRVEYPDELTIAQMNAIVRSAREAGLSSVKLTGGEPLLRKDIGLFMKECHASGVAVTVETNGTLIDESMADLMSECRVEHVAVSLDSRHADVHDRLRGREGAFQATVSGIHRLLSRGLDVQVIMSLYRENLEGFTDFLEFLSGTGVSDVKVNTITPVGRGEGLHDQGDVPAVAEVIAFAGSIQQKRGAFRGKVYMDIPPAFKSIDELKTGGGCSACAVKSILGVLSDGRVSLCGIGYMAEGMIFGDLREDPGSIVDIWDNEPVLKRIRAEMPDSFEGVCGKCVMKSSCLGSCRAEVYHNTGNLMSPYWFCQEAYEEGLFPRTRLMPEGSTV
ncbi:MAG: radical SAM protein [Candidatus Omnitrophica bacterium]|nr:radical SAM protein [Candidatus Omnitrophota bacterium]